MQWNVNRGRLAFVVSMVVFIMMSVPLYAAENKQDTEITMHDYILDRQQSFCSMVQMKDDELSDVNAAGFSSFTLTDDVTRAYFNVEAQTFTEIQSLKMGYYNNGWDEDWTNVSLGSSTEDLICKGLYIEASFSNISDGATRTLNSLKVGTPSMTGPITANFNSFSGCIKTAGVTDPIVNQSRGPLNSGQLTTIYSNPLHNNDNNSEFFMQLSKSGTAGTPNIPAAPAGWWFYWSNATVTLAP